MKLPWLIVISLLVFTGLTIFAYLRRNESPTLNFLNFFIVGLTLIVLIVYAYDTHRIANQTLETSLKPIVLRGGYIIWDSIQFTIQDNTITGKPIEFSVQKNIAKDISGYIILNKRKYILLFANPISAISNTSSDASSSQQLFNYNSTWGWLAPNSILWAVFNPTQYEQTNQENAIYIKYEDTEGNDYYTEEDKNYSHHFGNL